MHFIVLPWFAPAGGHGQRPALAATDATSAHMQQTGFAPPHGLRTCRTCAGWRRCVSHGTGARLARLRARRDQEPSSNRVARPSDPAWPIEAAMDVTDLAMKTCGGRRSQTPSARTIIRMRERARSSPTADHLRDFIGRTMTGCRCFERRNFTCIGRTLSSTTPSIKIGVPTASSPRAHRPSRRTDLCR